MRLKKAKALLLVFVIGGAPLVTLATCDRQSGYFELFRDDDAGYYFDDDHHHDGYYEDDFVYYDEFYYEDEYYYEDCFFCF